MAAVPALWAPEVGADMVRAGRAVDLSQAYLSLTRPLLLYVWMPLVTVAVVVLLMAPGLLLATIVTRPASMWTWLLDGFGLTLVLVSSGAAAVQGLAGRPLTGRAFVAMLAGMVLLLAIWVIRRGDRGGPGVPVTRQDRTALSSLVVVPLGYLVALLPKFFWESFNGDGAHTVEATRLLLFQATPFFSAEAGGIASWPGLNGVVPPYQASWFLRLFGPIEAAVRLPLVLNMALLVAAIAAVAEARRKTRLDTGALVFVWGSVICYSLAMSYAATYNPYSADVAMPAPQDTLVMVAYLAGIAAFSEGDRWRLAWWSLVGLCISPAGLLMLGATLGAIWVVHGQRGWRHALPYAAGLAGLVLLVGALSSVLTRLEILQGGGEHSGVRLVLRQFGTIALLDVERFAWILIPAGLYPAACVLGWRSADRESRLLVVTAALLFAFFYPMGALSLHYFVPVMILPIAAFWRTHGSTIEWRKGTLVASGVALAVAIGLSLPTGTAVYDGSRLIGERIDASAYSGYHANDPAALRAAAVLGALFPTDAHPDVPARRYGDSPLAWNYYAQQRKSAAVTSYVLTPAGAAVPPGAVAVGRTEQP